MAQGPGSHEEADSALHDQTVENDADVLALSSCVQMPSLAAIQAAEDRFGLPTFSATTYEALDHLNLSMQVPSAGTLLTGGMNV